LIIDYSKYHDVRIDNQLATGTPVPDVVQLQTTQDFTRWKEAGVLRLYKPSGFSKVYPGFKDPDGAWVAIAVYAFSYMYDDALGDQAPASPLELVDPRWKDAIASAYPHDGPESKPSHHLAQGGRSPVRSLLAGYRCWVNRSVLAGPDGHPFHPLLVPLPVGAFVSSLIFDILTRTRASGLPCLVDGAFWLIGVGLAGALAAAVPGVVDLRTIPGRRRHRAPRACT
jgi:hypothetical protein